jgi:uncharacterized membrane protein
VKLPAPGGPALARLRALAARVQHLPGHPLVDAAVIGIATGGRTSAGLAALAWTAPAGDLSRSSASAAPKPLALFQKKFSKPVQTVALVGELVGDKLPSTPSRLERAPLISRISTGSTAATALAQRHDEAVWPAAGLGAVGAAAGSWLGSRWRRRAARRGQRDLGPALLEDAVTLLLAAYATRRPAVARHNSSAASAPGRQIDQTSDGLAAQPRVN